jgi:hypothetical protein
MAPFPIRAALPIGLFCAFGMACSTILGIGEPTVASDGGANAAADGTILAEGAAEETGQDSPAPSGNDGSVDAMNARRADASVLPTYVPGGLDAEPIVDASSGDMTAFSQEASQSTGAPDASDVMVIIGDQEEAGKPEPGAVGDPCKSDNDCSTTFCLANLWCTMECTTNQMCGKSSAGIPNVCVSSIAVNGQKLCRPGCSDTSTCRAFASNASCVPYFQTADDTFVGMCQTESLADGGIPTGKDGDPCQTSDDCASGYCNNDFGCTEVCSSSESCGKNSAGVSNACQSANGPNICFSGCRATSECVALAPSFTCEQEEDVNSNPVAVCSNPALADGGIPTGKDGDECQTGDDCASGDCYGDPSGAQWCTEVCSTSQACGSSSAGVLNVCVIAGSGLYKCVPTCSGAAPCQMNATCSSAETIEMNAVMICGSRR